jgi:vacuolar protein sorting-associated protein 11
MIQEDMSAEPVLKAWALDKLVKKTNMPTCLSTVSINNARRQFPVRLSPKPIYAVC